MDQRRFYSIRLWITSIFEKLEVQLHNEVDSRIEFKNISDTLNVDIQLYNFLKEVFYAMSFAPLESAKEKFTLEQQSISSLWQWGLIIRQQLMSRKVKARSLLV